MRVERRSEPFHSAERATVAGDDGSSVAGRGRVVVIGAGPAGCLMSVYLARRGYDVDIYESRPDQRIALTDGKRAINLTLTHRGISALDQVGLAETALAASVPLRGRMVHLGDGVSSFQAYGVRPNELLFAVRRGELTGVLLDAVTKEPGIQVHFETRCTDIDRERRTVFLTDQVTGRQYDVTADHIIGADGTFSTVRTYLQRGTGFDFRQESLGWGYREMVVPAQYAPEILSTGVLHIWPRDEHVLLAIPNADGSFLCMCAVPFHGPTSFETLTTPAAVGQFLAANFGDAIAAIPGISDQFLDNPTAAFSTVRTSPWHFRGNVVLIGDACHPVYPFYGQGLNAALEDCSLWNRLLDDHHDNWQRAADAFQTERKPATDMLVELSKRNFVELRRTAATRRTQARKKADLALARLLPNLWRPLYTMVSHSTMPYDAAVRRAELQQRIARWLCVDLFVLIAVGSAALRDQIRRIRPAGKTRVEAN